MEKNNTEKVEAVIPRPKIAVVVCNYNDSRFLIDVLSRINAQQPDELIVVDDRSDDRSMELLFCMAQFMKFKVVRNEGVHSPFGSFVAGCRATDAEYISCFSADDFPKEDYMKTMRAVIERFPMVDLYTCNTDVIREGRVYKRTLFPFTSYISPDYLVKLFRAGFAKNVNQCGVVIKREHVLKCWEGGGKNTSKSFDCMYSFSTAFEKGFVNIGQYLTVYRSYPTGWGASGGNKKIKQAIKIHRMFLGGAAHGRALQSGIWSAKSRWLSLIALWGIMKMPKWARRIFYSWFYSYDEKGEKL